MPFTLHLEPESSALIAVSHGVLTAEDVLAYIEEARPHVQPGSQQLVDLRVLEDAPISADEMSAIATATEHSLIKNGLERVIVIAPGDLAFGMSRMYAALCERYKIAVEIYRSEGPARQSLNRVSQ